MENKLERRLSKAQLRREIEKEISEYNPENLFSDNSLLDILESIVIGACEMRGAYPNLVLNCDSTSEFTAATNGCTIFQNSLGPLIRDLPTNWEKYVANVGHTVHEVGHVLFTKFKELEACMSAWRSGKFMPKDPAEIEALSKAFDGKEKAKALYAELMCNIENSLEDAYIENLLRIVYDGVAVQGIALVNKEMYRKMGTKEDVINSAILNNLPPLSIAEALLLSRYVCGKELPDGNLDANYLAVLDFVEGVIKTAEEEINKLLWEQDGKTRAELLNSLYIKFLPLFPADMFEDVQTGDEEDGDREGSGKGSGKGSSENSGDSSEEGEENSDGNEEDKKTSERGASSSGNKVGGKASGDLSEEDVQRITEYIRNRNKEIGKSQEPSSQGIPLEEYAPIEVNEKNKEEAKEKAERAEKAGEVNGNLALDKAIKEAVRDSVLSKDEKAHEKELQQEANDIKKSVPVMVENVGFSRYELKRATPGSSALYNNQFHSIRKSAENLLRKLKNIMREREVESVSSGYMMGQKFNARDVVNRDGKYFSRQVLPDGKITTAFGVLIDESGSMRGDKNSAAKRAAMLFEYVLRNLGVPHIICGHTAEYRGAVIINQYADFDTRDNRDYLRLTGIAAKGGNIDGAAITYMGEKLLKRPENKKVLIVISDGLPAGNSFYSRDMNEDTKLAAEHYRKKGIDVFGAILDETDEVSRIYGKDYCFDCKKSGELERQFIKLIKRYVLMKR